VKKFHLQEFPVDRLDQADYFHNSTTEIFGFYR
jgi:hypothetical protein